MQQDYVSVSYKESFESKKHRHLDTYHPKTNYPHQLARHLIQRFNLAQGSRLVDVGCGRGDLAIGFRDNGLRVEGLDSADSSIQELQSQGIKNQQVDIERAPWPIADNSIDVVFSKSVLEHIHQPDNFMSESHRILKPGGRIIIMTPDWETTYQTFYDDHSHVQPYTIRGLYRLLLIHEFKDVQTEQFYQLPVLWKYPALKLVSKFLGTFLNPNPRRKIKFIRWSVELMCLGTGVK